MKRIYLWALLLGLAPLSYAQIPTGDILPVESATRAWPVARHLEAPESLRPCCAFGYDLHVRAIGVPVPVYQIGNVLSVETLGSHLYNDSALAAVKNIVGISEEKSGLIYTRRGGFIDIAHVRDTADNTFYLFTRIYPRLGSDWRLFYSEELGLRRIQLKRFTPPSSPAERYTLAAWLAGHLAFQLAQWHEIAQWYGFQSVKGFSEEVSAFSPEDLYSNLLGARLAINVILQGNAGTTEKYNAAMEKALRSTLTQLGAVSEAETERQFHEVDGVWWNSHRRVPDKFLVLNRNYILSDTRYPTPVPFEKTPPYQLIMPEKVAGHSLAHLGQLQIYPGNDMRGLKAPAHFYTPAQFPALAEKAKYADQIQLQQLHK
ncbi:DUF4056 domain-containing protein [Rahnella woolbedingensis]|uniref:DUF4056 domain-containing protein n=1 Tax=Rahnella woolbedingensis TaxID=1510574 RepID=A0A419N7K9_9GAMM|nr:DUF4056 domain-containing protein [Rahnella woolbedingensis]RJT43399.1 DUF4056 domain-containing protein [Rahnella woolbedingensis]